MKCIQARPCHVGDDEDVEHDAGDENDECGADQVLRGWAGDASPIAVESLRAWGQV
jgi:hypothetical protein